MKNGGNYLPRYSLGIGSSGSTQVLAYLTIAFQQFSKLQVFSLVSLRLSLHKIYLVHRQDKPMFESRYTLRFSSNIGFSRIITFSLSSSPFFIYPSFQFPILPIISNISTQSVLSQSYKTLLYTMDNSYYYSNFVRYQFHVSQESEGLFLQLKAHDQVSSKTFELKMGQQLKKEWKKSFRDCEELFKWLGKEENFIVDPMSGKVNILKRKLEENEVKIDIFTIQLELVEETKRLKKKIQTDSDEDYGTISQIDFPSFDQQPPQDQFDRQIKQFERTMDIWKRDTKEKIQILNAQAIKFSFMYNEQSKWGGKYEGETRDNKPYGIGLFKSLDGTVLWGEWKEGKLHGKAFIVYNSGDETKGEFYENKRNGKFSVRYKDGEKTEIQWKNGKIHGKRRDWNSDGTLKKKYIYNEGKQV